ncbi:protein DYAD isoform X1 [Prunus avium]|uniref:Protein DYAD isoform X1 n=1 Tax=Prunus avium TaxID=42229 RepID=A0A6P5RU59_PRUAV|nr:protein DYAD isoform X1 [Prunus avium]XP_021806121.1 protein DYAD isoform X1 [Prunus avium]XP_021806122.1 protein DYAD isoform X1 [Prunus avium]
MAQWGTRRRRVKFLGQHEENKPQISSSITEEENSTDEFKVAVKAEPLEIPEIKKRKRLSLGKGRWTTSSSKGRTKKRNNVTERWTAERYKLAEESMMEVLKAEGATFGNPISRLELRSLARKRIGDTGLLDHLLKHIDGKVAPGGTERFRRWFNTNGTMEYWLESADLVNIRQEAGVHDPYWIPPSKLMPGGAPSEDSVAAAELKLLKAEVDKMKSDMQELLLSKKQEKDRANQQNMLEDLLKWKAQTEQSLKVILGSWKGMQDKFEELMMWKAKVEQQVAEMTNVMSNMQVPKQYTATNPETSERWEDWLESTNLDNFQGNELVPWFESTNLVNAEEGVIIQDPYLAPPLRSKHGDSSFPDPFCKIKEEITEMERNRDVHELIPRKQKEYQANVTPDSSATANSKSEIDNLFMFQEMLQELFNWKSMTEQKLSEMSNSVNAIKQTSKLMSPPFPPQLPEDGNLSMEYHPCFMF